MYNLLYCFISHQSVLEQDINKWSDLCKKHKISDYLIVVGNSNNNYISNNVLHLNCDDSYEGLSDKIYNLFKFLTTSYQKYDFYVKIDRDMDILKKIDKNLDLTDYCGYGIQIKKGYDGKRNWHFNKCSKDSEWNTKPYPGIFIPWCRGGSGYILSHKAAEVICCNPPDSSYHIYEDLYVAQTLLSKGNIHPRHLRTITEYFSNLNNPI